MRREYKKLRGCDAIVWPRAMLATSTRITRNTTAARDARGSLVVGLWSLAGFTEVSSIGTTARDAYGSLIVVD